MLSNQLEEKFARFEAILSHGNIFSTPKIPVSKVSAPLSNQPFFDPSDPRATGPVRPLGPDVDQVQKKDKGAGKKSKKTKSVSASSSLPPVPEDSPTGDSFFIQPAIASKVDTPGPGSVVSPRKNKSADSSSLSAPDAAPVYSSGATGHASGPVSETTVGDSDNESVTDRSVKGSEEGEISDTETVEQNEEMIYKETVRSVRALLGWSHIPDIEFSASDGDRSDNPWKGRHPRKTGKISVELPADDWLCHKMERLNTTVAEGYPSRSQESAGLKVDQFVRTPKSQAKWYQQYRIRQDTNTRPGKSIFSWSDSDARLNSQFSRIAKVSSYPQSGPASRPVPQDILRGWEKCAREGTYVTNHAAAFNRCTSNIQEKMNAHIALLNDTIVKGKAPKEIVDATWDLRDLSAFHSNVSVALGTALQHLADSLFIQLANFILLRQDFYLEFVKTGLKPDTWNKLRNAPLFHSALFPDDILASAEQDILKHESAPGAQGPGPGTTQHSGRKQSHYRYKPYDKKEARQAGYSSQPSQPWRQFSHKSRGRGRGRGGGNSSFFSKSSRSQQFK